MSKSDPFEKNEGPRWGAVLKSRRESLGLSRGQLAQRTGLSVSTIKNLERSRHQPMATTLARLAAVPELVAPDSFTPGPALNWWLAPEFDPLKMLHELEQQLAGAGGQIEQTLMYLDPKSADDWLAIVSQQEYEKGRLSMPAERAAIQILHELHGQPLDVLALGCGDGRAEVSLVQQLLGQTEAPDLRLYLLDISPPLLVVAYRHAVSTLPGHASSIFAVQGNFFHLPRYTQLHRSEERAHRRRLILMLGGTFANLDNEMRFVRSSLVGFGPGDLLLVDLNQAYGPVDKPEEILARDPRLNGQLPSTWRHTGEVFLAGPIHRHAQDVQGIEFSSHLDITSCPVPGSYAVEVRATIRFKSGATRVFTMFRFKRHDIRNLAEMMKQQGWDPVQSWPYGDAGVRYPRVLYLFRRRQPTC